MNENEKKLKAYELALLRMAAMPDSMKQRLMGGNTGEAAFIEAVDKMIDDAELRMKRGFGID